jgi:RHS repeat-associated protein
MRKALAGLFVILASVLSVTANDAARAEGNWTDFSLPDQTPFCGGGGCPTLEFSCLSASYSWWPAAPGAHLKKCEPTSEDSEHALVDAICCGQLYNAWPDLDCPPGQIPDVSIPTGCRPPDPGPCPNCVGAAGFPGGLPDVPLIGGSIVVPGGSVVHRVVDFTTPGPNVLSFERNFNSHSRATLGLRNLPLGHKWVSNFDRFMWSASSSNYNTMYAMRPRGNVVQFTLSGGVYSGPSDQPLRLVKTATTFEVTDTDDTLETYDLTGKLLSIERRNGYTQTLAYDGNGKLQSVTDSYGRMLQFQFSGDRLSKMIAVDGTVYAYQYDHSFSATYQPQPDRLIGVIYPKLSGAASGANPQIAYHYENATYPLWLTGITDEKGARYVTWAHDSDGRVTASESANDLDETTLTFNTDGSVTETNPLGKQIVYEFTTVAGRPHVTSIEQQASANTPAATETRTYDANGFVASRTDFEGNVTTFVHDSKGQQTSRTEAYGTAQARTITTTWHNTFRVPTQMVEPGKTMDFTHDSSGRVLTKTETDTRTQSVPYSTNGQTRTWTYTWDSTGLLQTVNGPRTDVSDVTTYSWTNGVLSSVTNALSQVTEIEETDERGLPTLITDPNGVVTDLGYNQRGWLTSVTKRSTGGDASTSFEYDAVGQITAIVQPDGVRLEYEYDNARRLTGVENSLGERIEYTLDDMGNRTAETIKNSGGSIVKSMSHTYDELGRLLENIGADSQVIAFEYDKNDNVTEITDPLSGVTAQAYDALDRLISSTDPATKVTAYGYDDQDNVTSVTDARSVQTTYVHDGFGRVIQTASPDAGTTVYLYDKADNLIEKTDGRSVVTQYSYDALNRITAKTFPAASAENVAYAYDDSTPGRHGIGRLSSITDQSGSTAFEYDSRGNVTKETRTIAGVAYVTGYVYDVADRLTQMVYPSGRIVAYARDALGRVTSVTTQANVSAAPAIIAANIAYKPFGPIASMSYGNGLTRSYIYDGDYRLTDLVTSDVDTNVQHLTYGYDDADNILSIADAIDSGRSQSFTYDALFRLKTAAATGTYGSITYNYDDVGNRTSVVEGATETYSTASSSNRLLSVTSGGVTRDFTYDGAGNIVEDDDGGSVYGLAYNKANRLSQVSLNGTPDTDYLYNALGERVRKAPAGAPSAATHFHYDRDGKLIAESNATGGLILEYVWLDGLPIAEFTAAGAGTPPDSAQVDNSDGGANFTGDWTIATDGSGYIGSNYRRYVALANGVPPNGTTIDNSSSNFSTSGLWPTATTPSGFEGSNYAVRDKAVDGYGGEIVIDNADAGFSATGTWTVSTNLNGYYGTNYLVHAPNQIAPEATIIDNVDAGFSTVGNWSTGTATGGRYGDDYRYHASNQMSPDVIVVDNADASTSLTGTWGTSTLNPNWGSNFRHSGAGTGSNTFTWTPSLPASKPYNVYAYWRQHSERATNAPFTVHHSGGSTTVTVNQQINGGQWNLLGTFDMAPGQNHRVVVTNNANGVVVADAIQFEPTDALPNRALWTPTISVAGDYKVYGWWRDSSAYTQTANFTTYHDGGSTTVTKNQEANGGKWNLLGTYPLTPGQNHRVMLTDITTGSDPVIADALGFAWTGLAPPTATWTPTLPRRDEYEVYARWEAHTDRATNAPYTIYHEGGSTTVTVNQRQNDSTWVLLGSFIMAPGQNHRVGLADTADGYVIADAVKFVPKTAAKTATWTVSVGTTGSYKVYAKWPASSQHATDVPYTVTHAGGTGTVTVNQRLNGGTWNLLGTYTFNTGTNYKVELSDAVAAGKVAADAIYIAPAGAPSSDAFTWTPAIPSSGSYTAYARWPASSANTGAAQYTVTHGGGTANVTLNQKQNGGTWVPLGSWSFAPNAGHKVALAASAEDSTIADAMLFVAAGAQPANLLYVHADHLGSPQKMTDASQATVWDGVFDPFGEEVSVTGLAAMPLRFPGQYADEETGFSYNYARHYAPSLGRYTQSDPIGLLGGLNLFGYTSGNPIGRIDPFGLKTVCGCVMGNCECQTVEPPEWHSQRNRHNKCPSDEPRQGKDCEGQEWTRDPPDAERIFHGGDLGYRTYRSPDPGNPGSGFQCTYDANGNLITSGPYRGTYDYSTPDDIGGAIQHFFDDVLPHMDWDGGYEDPDQTQIYCDECEL